MIRVHIISVSDRVRSGEAVDLSGENAEKLLRANGYCITGREVLADEKYDISDRISAICDSDIADLILTIGGTGLGRRDVTPEATKEILDREVPGICEMLRLEGFRNTRNAVLSRGISGIRGNTLIINLPGSTKAVEENLGFLFPILEHAILMINGKGHDHEEYLINKKGGMEE